jgi:hypothetical protein
MLRWDPEDMPPFNPDPPTGEEAGQLKRDFEAGDFMALHEAFLRFAAHDLPLPEWVLLGVNGALEHAWVRNAGSKGQKSGGYKSRTASYLFHAFRHDVAARHLAARGSEGGPRTREEAFEQARDELAADEELRRYRGSAGAIEKSYNLIQGVLKPSRT